MNNDIEIMIYLILWVTSPFWGFNLIEGITYLFKQIKLWIRK